MGTIYQISLNLAILVGVFIIFRKIYQFLNEQADKDSLFLDVEREYNSTLNNYKEFGLPKFVFLYSFEEKKYMKDEISDENEKQIDTIDLINEIKNYNETQSKPYFFYSKKVKATKKQSINLIIQDIKDSMSIKFPNQSQLAIVIVNEDILYFIHEPNNFYAGASDSISTFLKT